MSSVCPELSSHNPLSPFITKDNVNEIVPDTFNRNPGATVTVSCNAPLVLNGESSFVCKDDLTWSYSFKPFCTSAPSTPDEGLDEETKVIIGIVCGVAGIIIGVLIIMVIAVWFRDRRRRGLKYEYWRESRPRGESRSVDYKTGFRDRDAPTTIDVEMFQRGTPPPPYRSQHDRQSDGKYRRYHGSYDCLTTAGASRFGSPMYLPGSSPGYTNYFDEVRRSRHANKERHGNDEYDDKPYVREWLSRSESMLDTDYLGSRSPRGYDRYHDRDRPSWRHY